MTKESLEFASFDLRSPKDLLEKINREIARAVFDADREHAGDHVVNAFWSAWHIHDWLWDAIKGNDRLKGCVLAKAGIRGDIKGRKQFGAALARQFRELEIARIIATSSKHVHVTLEPDSPRAVRTHFSSGEHFTLHIDGKVESPITRATHWIPKVTFDNQTILARDVLNKIDAFWVDLLYGCDVDARGDPTAAKAE